MILQFHWSLPHSGNKYKKYTRPFLGRRCMLSSNWAQGSTVFRWAIVREGFLFLQWYKLRLFNTWSNSRGIIFFLVQNRFIISVVIITIILLLLLMTTFLGIFSYEHSGHWPAFIVLFTLTTRMMSLPLSIILSTDWTQHVVLSDQFIHIVKTNLLF